MGKIKPKSGLSKELKEELSHLYLHLKAPAIILRLRDGVLSREESRAFGNAENGTPLSDKKWPSPQKVLDTVARHRRMTRERALLELARSLDLIGVGKYERLRKAIGEPVVPERNDVPSWDKEARELRYKGKMIRRLSPTATSIEIILGAFQDDGWPSRIDDPLPPANKSGRLREAVRNVNKGLQRIKFFCDGSGQGVLWREK